MIYKEVVLSGNFESEMFLHDKIVHLFNDKIVDFEIDGRQFTFKFIPTALSQRIDICLFCFSLDNPDGFHNNFMQWYYRVKVFCPDVPLILVGVQNNEPGAENVVSSEDARAKVKKIKQAIAYVESPFDTKESYTELFKAIAKAPKFAKTHGKCYVM